MAEPEERDEEREAQDEEGDDGERDDAPDEDEDEREATHSTRGSERPARSSLLGPIAAVGVTVVVAVATARAFAEARAGTMGFWGTLGATYGVLATIAVVRAWRQNEWYWLAPRWGDFTRGFFGAAIFFAASFAFVKLALAGPREAWVDRAYAQMGEPTELRTHFARVALLLTGIAFSEEVVWRGMVTSLLEEQLGSRRAWLGSTLLYTLAHLPTAWVLAGGTGWNPVLVLAAAPMGLLFSGMTRRFDRVPPVMVAHALFLIAATMMFRLTGTSV